jgi:hypothetical protein
MGKPVKQDEEPQRSTRLGVLWELALHGRPEDDCQVDIITTRGTLKRLTTLAKQRDIDPMRLAGELLASALEHRAETQA